MGFFFCDASAYRSFAPVMSQERSFQRGVSYVVAMVAEFDEYTNDWLYLREGTVLPKYCILP
jgi:hypothetical protein